MRKTLTAAAILRLRPQPGLCPEISDAGCPGLYVLVHPSGKKTFVFRYRRPVSGRGAKLTLGEFDAENIEEADEPKLGGLLSLAAARTLASQARRQVKLGRDPGEEYLGVKAGRRAQQRETFEVAARQFITRYSKGKNRRWRDTAHLLGFIVDKKTDTLKDELLPHGLARKWRDLPVTALRKRDVTKLVDDYMDGGGSGYTMNGLVACLRRMFNWLIERGATKENPLLGMKMPQPVTSRDRVLTDVELAAFWKCCDTLGEPFGPLLKLLLLTGQRRDEVARMSHDELNAAGDLWSLPPARTKNKRPHTVPLSAHAQGIVEGVTRSGNRWVFTTTGRTPVSGFSKAKHQLDKLLRQELGEAFRPWRVHDLRRTCATRLAELGVRQEVTENILNHATGKVSGVAAIYNRYDYSTEKRAALERWAARVQGIVALKVAESLEAAE